jgi:hypothetical protein
MNRDLQSHVHSYTSQLRKPQNQLPPMNDTMRSHIDNHPNWQRPAAKTSWSNNTNVPRIMKVNVGPVLPEWPSRE